MNSTTTQPTVSGWVDFNAAGVALPAATSAPHTTTAFNLSAPGFHLAVNDAHASIATDAGAIAVVQGDLRLADTKIDAQQWLTHYRHSGTQAIAQARGRFAVFIIDFERRCVFLATDRFSAFPVCLAVDGQRFAFSNRADRVPLQHAPRLNVQALYDYLYFHVIPAPATVFVGVQRLACAQQAVWSGGAVQVSQHWAPQFAEDRHLDFNTAKNEFRSLLRASVEREAAGVRTGAFLSGGTDSSTVSGLLGQVAGQPAETYSIGFDAEGYDEIAYARLAAQHFGCKHHAYYVTPDDLVSAIPSVAAHYDQPFGNSSAVPAFYCAQRARADGLEKILAGDGGDELFGGNARYAKQKVFDVYNHVPAGLRSNVLEPLLLNAAILRKLPIVKKAVSYVEQARTPMPERAESYNLLERIGAANLLTQNFLSRIDARIPRQHQQTTYDRCNTPAMVNRMLAYDWQYTLADNDLPKVTGTCSLAQLQVGFPMLSDELLDFSLRLPVDWKVKGLTLRYFFKEALRGFLPDEIIRKRKHGFGLPFGVWLAKHAALQRLAFDSIDSLTARGLLRADYVQQLKGPLLAQHAGYYGEMIWILMMLEHWLRAHGVQDQLA